MCIRDRLKYNATFEKGPVSLNFTFVKSDGNWLIKGVRYNSPLLVEVLTCKSCSKMNASLQDFCSFCGKPIKEK